MSQSTDDEEAPAKMSFVPELFGSHVHKVLNLSTSLFAAVTDDFSECVFQEGIYISYTMSGILCVPITNKYPSDTSCLSPELTNKSCRCHL